VTSIHHFVATYEPGAVGGHIAEMQRLCLEQGWASEVFTEHLRGGMQGRDFRDYAKVAKPDDVLVYHTAIGSPVSDFVEGRAERLVVDHHNITPVQFFAPWEPAVAHALAWARAQLVALAPRAALGIGDSSYNESELRDAGYAPTTVAPILFDFSQFERVVDPAHLRVDAAVWLFVGRIAPNKRHEDLIKAFAVYRRVYDGGALLRIVGGSASDGYVAALHDLVSALQLDDAVDFVGPVSDEELTCHYLAADVYVCVSEHEGFCVPVLEAMHNRLPVVAFGATAVGETVGRGGVCLPRKDAGTVAAAAHRVLTDPAVRAALVVEAGEQLARFALPASRRRMVEALETVL
jgi:glycosyltransferase involved in cell wall biosynthesis